MGVTASTQEIEPALGIDARLTEIERQVDVLLNLTPLNGAEAWDDFKRSDFTVAPTLRLRELDFDPDLVRRELYNLEIEDVADPALHSLFRAKRDEIARQITALEDRDTTKFVHGSRQLFGDPSPSLVSSAEQLLADIEPPAPARGNVTSGAFADAARDELEHYRAAYPEFPVEVEVREDVSELMVSSEGHLLIPEAGTFRADRVEPLLHHEVGTHVVTYQNGARQPLKMLTIGLPGYDETQEGLALISEYVTGGLDPRRLRVLAARVVAVDLLIAGATFMEIFETLESKHRIPRRTAWSVAVRVVVAGGMVRDAIYLRGISRILEAVASGVDLDVLLVGKLALDHVDLVQDLLDRGVLEPPWVRPRWLEVPGARERLDRMADGLRVTDLYEGDGER
nr:tyrosine/phenylalanine carboxypeptidase domain-containing protein [Nocardioides sp. KC13]